jgi:hypothetical protein
MQAQIVNLSILRGDAQGQMVQLYECNTAEYTYVASGISLARWLLSHPQAIQAMAILAIEFDNANQYAWYTPRLNSNMQTAMARVQDFLARVRHEFPFVVIDERIANNANVLAYHPRGQWDPTAAGGFDPRRQSICINAEVVPIAIIFTSH